MLRSYLRIAIRSLTKNRFLSITNIAGLSMGITVSIIILIFVAHEYSYDRFHANSQRIVRAEKVFSRDGRHSLYANPQFAPELKAIDPRIINYVRLFEPGRRTVSSDAKHKFFEERFIFSDTSFFSVFSFPLIQGNRAQLTDPFKVILSASTAQKYFGKDDPIGKTIAYDKDYIFEVVGIAQNPPSNSSIKFDFVASFNSLLAMPWSRDMIVDNSSGFPSYLLLSDPKDIAQVSNSILKTNYTNTAITYSLAPFLANHFDLNFGDTSNIRYVYVFLCIGLLILALAIINYANLTTALAIKRAKEVGVRKVIGARRLALSFQFFLESAVTTIISFAIAVILIEILLPKFMLMMQLDIDASFMTSLSFLIVIGALLIVCILLSGFYPSLILSGLKPVEVLKGKFSSGNQGTLVRKVLTVFQFSVSMALIICTLIVNLQLDFLKSKNIGLDREQVLVLPVDPFSSNSLQILKAELKQQSGVVGVATASIPLYQANFNGVSLVQSPGGSEKVGTKWFLIDKEFLSVLDVAWMQQPENGRLEGTHLINETAYDAFGGAGGSVGYDVSMGDGESGIMKGKIVGVLKDFNYQSLRTKVEPLILTIIPDSLASIGSQGAMYVRLAEDVDVQSQIAALKTIYERNSGDTPFTYYFLDDAFDDLQKGEQRLSEMFNVFTFVALSIACLGLLGLVVFTVERRVKEISIRKILGASLWQVLSILSGQMMTLVIIGILIGTPVAWIAMADWLQNFHYQTDVPLLLLFIPAVAVAVVALAILTGFGSKAALDNPVEYLKND